MQKYPADREVTYKLLFLLSCLLLIIFRHPDLLWHPRVWAEEGSVFYAEAYNRGWNSILLKPLLGYYSLYSTLITGLALLLPVFCLPWMTTITGLLLQLLLIAYILFSETPYGNHAAKKILLIFFLILSTPAALWLNSIGAHFHLALISFLILLKHNKTMLWEKALLLLAGLSGPVACFLTPVFLRKYLKTRNRSHLQDLLILLLCSLIQVIFIILAQSARGEYERFTGFSGLRSLLYAWLNDAFGMLLIDTDRAIYLTVLPILMLTVFLFYSKRKDLQYQLIIFSFFLITLLSTLGSLGMKGSPRYSYIPSFILMCIFINEVFDSSNVLMRWSSRITVIALLLLSIYNYRTGFIYNRQPLPEWNSEVEKWEQNKDYPLKIHPDGWEMELRRRKQ